MSRLQSALSRTTTSGQLIAEIDGLRFLSIALVVLFHLEGSVAAKSTAAYVAGRDQNPLKYVLLHGNQGVELFFIISGFVLALPFAAHHLTGGRRVDLRAYFTRRLTRLEPPYLLAMGGTLAAVCLVRDVDWVSRIPELLAHFFYVHNWVYGRSSSINEVAWSLEIEVQWYVLAPVVAPALFRIRRAGARRAAIVGLSAAAIAGQLLAAHAGIRMPLSILGFVQYFLMGLLLADLYLVDWRTAPTQHRAWDAAWVASWAALVWAWNQGAAVSLALFPWLALAMCVASFRGVWARRVVGNRWLVVMGGMCYTIYLLHLPIFGFIGGLTVGIGAGPVFLTHYLVQVLLTVPVVLLASAVFFVLVEKPCMDRQWPARLAARLWALRGQPAEHGRLVTAGAASPGGRERSRIG